MSPSELVHIETLSEIDALTERMRRHAAEAPDWRPAEACRAMTQRLLQRVDTMRVRWEAPLLVAALGGSGTGKSSLVNAIIGEEIATTGRNRPTTIYPTLICRPDVAPESLGIDPRQVEVVYRDLPILRDVIIVDCPDPDTSERVAETDGQAEASSVASEKSSASIEKKKSLAEGNLARLRAILPHCDALLVVATQQKYRSAKVGEELAAAAPGAHLFFVQTHADEDDDVRADWGKHLKESGSSSLAVPAKIKQSDFFFVDSLAALKDAVAGLQPRGEFARLIDALHRQLSGASGKRIRRANFLDLTADMLERSSRRIDDALPSVEELRSQIAQRRAELASRLAERMRGELLAGRRLWEHRLVGQAASRWGVSPFALVLRLYQGFGALLAGTTLYRMRTPAQLAVWGAAMGVRTWRKKSQDAESERRFEQAATDCWDHEEIRKAALVLEGYADEAGVPRDDASLETIVAEAGRAGDRFVAAAASQVDAVVAKLAAKKTGFFTRSFYNLAFIAMLGGLLFRVGKNFFYDSIVGSPLAPVFGLDSYLVSGFWLVLWCAVLLVTFTGSLRGGLKKEIDRLADAWRGPEVAAGLFVALEDECRKIGRWRAELQALIAETDRLRRRLASPEE